MIFDQFSQVTHYCHILIMNHHSFTGIAFKPDMSIRYNTAAWPRVQVAPLITRRAESVAFRLISRLPKALRKPVAAQFTRIVLTVPPPLDPGLRRELTSAFRDDILRTQTLIERDLSNWLS
jgi:hypothetical protein